MFYDIRRLKGFSLAALAVVTGLACHGLILRAALGRADSWMLLRGQTFNVVTTPDRAFKRTLGIKRDFAAGVRIDPDTRLGLLLGSSTLRQGVDPTILDADTGGGYRWTNINVPTHPYEIDLVTRALYGEGVKPAALALVATPGVLVADRDREAEGGWYDPSPFLKNLKGRKVEMARSELVALTMVPWNLAFPYRGQVFLLADRYLLRAKLRMLGSLGQGLDALAAPETDPWLNPYPPEMVMGTPEGNERILKFIGVKGWFEAENYRADGPNYDHLVSTFRAAHEHGTRTFLVLVPETSALRARLPASAADHLKRTLVDALGAAAPVILDFREAMPDDEFYDVNHLSPAGREHFSHRLAGALKPSLAAGPPKP